MDAMEDILDGPRHRARAIASPSRSAAAGLDEDWVRRVDAIAGRAATHASLKALWWVASTISAQELATEVVESTERMSTLVKAIKTYAYMDRGEVVVADVHEGLDSTLIMLKHKLKHTAIKVERDYDKSLPKLTMHGSELNQVWTNLLDNAIGALGETGTITITTTADNGCIKVDIADDGPGIPEDVRQRIFDPFFTTKAPGSRHGHGAGHRAAHRRAAPRRLADVRHRRRRHDLPRLAASGGEGQEMNRCSHRIRSRSPSCRRRSPAARTAWRRAASGCTCASA